MLSVTLLAALAIEPASPAAPRLQLGPPPAFPASPLLRSTADRVHLASSPICRPAELGAALGRDVLDPAAPPASLVAAGAGPEVLRAAEANLRDVVVGLLDPLAARGDEAARRHELCVGLFDDRAAPNSMAVGSWWILFGVSNVDQLLARPGGSASVEYVAAHELAHVLQGLHGVQSADTTKRAVELQADCVAGHLMALSRLGGLSAVSSLLAADTASSLGDRYLTHADHHGTPEQRRAAVARGRTTLQLSSQSSEPTMLHSRAALAQCATAVDAIIAGTSP